MCKQRIRSEYTTRKAGSKTHGRFRSKKNTSETTKVRSGQSRFQPENKKPSAPVINKPIVKLMEKPIEQSKFVSTVPIPKNSRIHDKIVPIPDYAIPQTRSGDDSSSRMDQK